MTATRKITLTDEQKRLLEIAATRPWAYSRGVMQERNKVQALSSTSPYREEIEKGLADLEERLEACTFFCELAPKTFGVRYYTPNRRPGVCPVTGEMVPEDRGMLVKENGCWVVYSRRGVLQRILEAAREDERHDRV